MHDRLDPGLPTPKRWKRLATRTLQEPGERWDAWNLLPQATGLGVPAGQSSRRDQCTAPQPPQPLQPPTQRPQPPTTTVRGEVKMSFAALVPVVYIARSVSYILLCESMSTSHLQRLFCQLRSTLRLQLLLLPSSTSHQG